MTFDAHFAYRSRLYYHTVCHYVIKLSWTPSPLDTRKDLSNLTEPKFRISILGTAQLPV